MVIKKAGSLSDPAFFAFVKGKLQATRFEIRNRVIVVPMID